MAGHLPYRACVLLRMGGGIVRTGILLTAWLLSVPVQGQCTTTISTFPYTEGFESAASWTSGGTGNDWGWGTPAHPNINSAANGNRAWCVGGLTGSFYTFGQQSFLEGPCFDLSDVAYPYISFSIFWECERTYDGMALQYSLNGGASWTNVGSVSGPTDCLNANWYNTANINNLQLASPRNGWSGRIGPTQGSCAGGQGSGGWVTASQCIGDLAGEPSVKFRFVFGAGTQCNDYDGIAIDDIRVGEAPPNGANFSFTCNGSTVGFTQNAPLCPTGFEWNFGDPASGAANISTAANPAHVFTAPGTYQVTLTVTGPCNAPGSITLPVTVLGVAIDAVEPACGADNGTLTAVVSGGPGPYSYAWAPGGQGTATIEGLAPGGYSVTVTAPNACAATAVAQLGNGLAGPEVSIATTPVGCFGGDDGTASLVVTGGTPPYSYAWSGGLPAAVQQTGLQAGPIACTVTDANGCTGSAQALVGGPDELVVEVPAVLDLCAGEPLNVVASAEGGTPAYTYTWTPPLPYEVPPGSTSYSVVATDQNGCSSAAALTTVNGAVTEVPVYTWSEPAGCAPHCVTFTAQGVGTGVRTWSFGDGSGAEGDVVEHCFTGQGPFPVTLTITGPEGCTATTTVPDLVEVWPLPQPRIATSATVVALEDATFELTATGADVDPDSVVWHFGDPLESTASGSQTVFTYGGPGCYTVELEAWSPDGCRASTTRLLCVEEDFAVHVPNAFTPNGDGFNDVFRAVSPVLQPRFYELEVFDRWGRSVFVSNAIAQGWDGTINGSPVPPGVHPWRLSLVDAFGVEHLRRGHVTLLR